MKRNYHIAPFVVPVLLFGFFILIGTLLLRLPVSTTDGSIRWIDALFTATSATCVTGLVVVDTGGYYTLFGQLVILGLIQFGGLGIMTIASLFFYLVRKQVTLTDRIAVGQSLLHDPSFRLGRFLVTIVSVTLAIEAAGALLLYLFSRGAFSLYSCLFHAVSAFCNAGFSLYSNSIISWRDDIGINLVFMVLIVLGGLGFSVLVELGQWCKSRVMTGWRSRQAIRFSWYSSMVLKTTAVLLVAGCLIFYMFEFKNFFYGLPEAEKFLIAMFQSVTCRTAGFNTITIGHATNVSLLFMILLMFIGGAPGSCAGGIKITTFRTVVAFVWAHVKGHRQPVIENRFAVAPSTLNKALVLFVFSIGVIVVAVLALSMLEGGQMSHPEARGLFLEILFEVVSAFGTVGLTTGLTSQLSVIGKAIIILVMFLGRLGPILFLAIIRSLQQPKFYEWPEEEILIG